MAEVQVDSASSRSYSTQGTPGHTLGLQLTRSDTGSTGSSTSRVPVPLPPGFYTLPIHGNCPRCHHHHKAAPINVRVSGDPSRVSHVYCERCKEKWLAFGGGNSTRMSLLSTQTADPDVLEQSFRYALFDMVRSMTSIASASALASVPEIPSRAASPEHSVRSYNAEREHVQSNEEAQSPPPGAADSAKEEIRSSSQVNGNAPDRPLKQPRALLQTLRARVEKHMLRLKKYRLVSVLRSKNKTTMTAKARGKLPNNDALDVPERYPSPSNIPARSLHRENMAPNWTVNANEQPSGSVVPEATGFALQADRELLQSMPKEQRVVWIREHLSDFKSRYSSSHYARRPTSSVVLHSVGDRDSQTPPPVGPPRSPLRPADRRYSDELILVGSHLHGFQPGELLYASRALSIGSTTHLSQAVTAVDSEDGAGIGPLPIDYQQTPTSRSLRPRSLPAGPSPLRHSLGPDDLRIIPPRAS